MVQGEGTRKYRYEHGSLGMGVAGLLKLKEQGLSARDTTEGPFPRGPWAYCSQNWGPELTSEATGLKI